jgi:formyltetrahydrofolate-dependent phosphoribosylglycinamide formyltransferase
MKKMVVFISGSGSNLQAIMDAIAQGYLKAEIVLVVSNRKDAYGLVRAEKAGIPTLYFPLKPYTDAGKERRDYDADLAEKVKPYAPDLIVLAGWMHILSPVFLDQFPRQVINLHPALPNYFTGTNAIQRAFDAYQQGMLDETGCMVHYVIPQVDKGEVIGTVVVPIYPEDTLEDLESRMHEAEHKLLVMCIINVFYAR